LKAVWSALVEPNSRSSLVGSGGADRDRTGDLLLAKQALSQLSYGPGFRGQRSEDGEQKLASLAPSLVA
jgi:hypothetical protein